MCTPQVAGTTGKVRLEGDDDAEGASTEEHGEAILKALGIIKRNEVVYPPTGLAFCTCFHSHIFKPCEVIIYYTERCILDACFFSWLPRRMVSCQSISCLLLIVSRLIRPRRSINLKCR